jgi:hypothetical protein
VTDTDRKLKRDLSLTSSVKQKIKKINPGKQGALRQTHNKIHVNDVERNSVRDFDSVIDSARKSTRNKILAPYMRSPYKLMDLKNQARQERKKQFNLSHYGIISRDEPSLQSQFSKNKMSFASRSDKSFKQQFGNLTSPSKPEPLSLSSRPMRPVIETKQKPEERSV